MFRKHKANYKHIFSVFIALGYRFLREKNNVMSVSYILNRADYPLISHSFDIIRLGLACLDRGICSYIDVSFLCTYFLLT